MALPIEDTGLQQAALAYVVALYDELTAQNGAPTLGIQNQAVDLILADPQLRRAVGEWAAAAAAAHTPIGEATTAPRRRPPQDALYGRVRSYLEQTIGKPVRVTPGSRRRSRNPSTGRSRDL
jgi:hypothetical protein